MEDFLEEEETETEFQEYTDSELRSLWLRLHYGVPDKKEDPLSCCIVASSISARSTVCQLHSEIMQHWIIHL